MEPNIKRRGMMLVLSAPSGAGKTTIAKLLVAMDEHLHTSTSYTTRSPRPGEVDGRDYFFTDHATFNKMIKSGMFLEYAEVFGQYYGTPCDFVEKMLNDGEDVLFDIDFQGHSQLKTNSKSDVASVFIFPPSKNELVRRLMGRGQDSADIMHYRMERANAELSHWREYDYSIINRDLNESITKMISILRAERLRKERRLGVAAFVEELLDELVTIGHKEEF